MFGVAWSGKEMNGKVFSSVHMCERERLREGDSGGSYVK